MSDNHDSTALLLPPYMSAQAWQDMAEVIDEVFRVEVHDKIEMLGKLRDLFIAEFEWDDRPNAVNHPVAAKIRAREMIDASEYDQFDVTTNRLRLNQLGMRVLDPSVLDAESINRLVQNLGLFWYEKGLSNFADFISYCLNAEITVQNMWTKDYVTFYPQGDPAVGGFVWLGGPWYPTTHIRIVSSTIPTFDAALKNLIRLFYSIANYNLVLDAVAYTEWHHILPQSQADTEYPVAGTSTIPVPANIVAMGVFLEREETLTNELPT